MRRRKFRKKLQERTPPPAPVDQSTLSKLADSLAQSEALRRSLNAAVDAAKPTPVVPAFPLASRLTAMVRVAP